MRGLICFCAGALTMAGVGLAIGAELNNGNIRETSSTEGTPIISVRPTGIGLPEIGIEGTTGAGELATPLHAYHNSGAYREDLEAVAKRAEHYLVRRVAALRRQARQRCARARNSGLRGPALTRACREPQPAIVFDIDETALSNYDLLAATDFLNAYAALIASAALANAPAIASVHDVYERALSLKVAVFFVTARPAAIPLARERTIANLAAAGYGHFEELILDDSDLEPAEFKSSQRADIEKRGYDIVVNLGDQESDLLGGHADRAYKLPNPFYFTG